MKKLGILALVTFVAGCQDQAGLTGPTSVDRFSVASSSGAIAGVGEAGSHNNRLAARNDVFRVEEGEQLVVPAPGVLRNDSYPPDSTIEFLPPFPPAGLTNVAPFNGGFILDMSVNPTFVGPLELRYVIHAGGDTAPTNTSNPATVTVMVR